VCGGRILKANIFKETFKARLLALISHCDTMPELITLAKKDRRISSGVFNVHYRMSLTGDGNVQCS